VEASLRQAVNARGALDVKDRVAALGDEVARSRDRLNRYFERLHEQTALGCSLHEALRELTTLENAPRLAIRWEDPTAVSRGLHEERLRRLSALAERASPVARVMAHPFLGCRVTEWRAGLDAAVTDAVSPLGIANQRLHEAAVNVMQALHLHESIAPADTSIWLLERLVPIVDLMLAADRPPVGLELSAPSINEQMARLRRLQDIGENHARLTGELSARWHDTLLEADVDVLAHALREAMAAPLPVRWWRLRDVRARLQPLSREKLDVDKRTLADIELARQVLRYRGELIGHEAFAREVLGPAWAGLERPRHRLGGPAPLAGVVGEVSHFPATGRGTGFAASGPARYAGARGGARRALRVAGRL